jgi:hypothetical protein
MKNLTMTILVVLVIGTSCKSTYPANGSFNESILMTIDCRNDKDLKQNIVTRLRGTKARNIQVSPDGHFLRIRAVFLKREVSPLKLVNLSSDIQNLGGVLQTLMEENRGVMVQTLDRGPIY